MIEDNATREYPMPTLDDGWWESVLAEESSLGTPNRSEVRDDAKKISVNWNQAQDLYQKDKIVELKVTGHNRGGLLVEGEGLNGFVPFSHLIEFCKTESVEIDFESYVGRTLSLKIIECTQQEDRIVFSERAAQTESGKRTELFHSLCEGKKCKAK
ncbi:MAG: S1 RNA-binding domain-containing protein [Anaerolineales bacterium]|nr:S1 RNA-binding domain-containing protein [Anaerolineales bacterium]